ncbi:hypothetical protein FB45DRAFT_1067624 [Roridomyces roridus]|uniref:Uncharacterized protein n=1 Tax=Roridomyces roridus TaxID=1738132 RepID=A0AAD7B2W1_9AGAR|nr:hypothetical protein FB45DRAFT_1067624 [Roridomyces roridus]
MSNTATPSTAQTSYMASAPFYGDFARRCNENWEMEQASSLVPFIYQSLDLATSIPPKWDTIVPYHCCGKRAHRRAREEAKRERKEAERRKAAKNYSASVRDEEAAPVTVAKKAIIRANLVDDPQAAAVPLPEFLTSPSALQPNPIKARVASSMSWRQTEVAKIEVEIPVSWGSDEELETLRKSRKTKTVCLQEELGRTLFAGLGFVEDSWVGLLAGTLAVVDNWTKNSVIISFISPVYGLQDAVF